MGQASSQVKRSNTEEQRSSAPKIKKKSKKKSLARESALDLEEESAKALMLLRESDPKNHGGRPSSDKHQASQEGIEQDSRTRTIQSSPPIHSSRKSSKVNKKNKGERKRIRKSRGSELFDLLGSEHSRHEQQGSQPAPFTPPPTNGHVPESPEDMRISISQHALDELSTDDEATKFDKTFGNGSVGVGSPEPDQNAPSKHALDNLSTDDEAARFDETFGKGSLSVESPRPHQNEPSQHALDEVSTDDEAARFDEAFGKGSSSAGFSKPNQDLYSFSQQPPDADQQNSMFPSYQLPRRISTSPKDAAKSNRDASSTKSRTENGDRIRQWAQMATSAQAGQYTASDPIEELTSIASIDSADHLLAVQNYELPIDPELHSMSALPPSVDLSSLAAGASEPKQKKRRILKQNTPPHPKKRRRTEELQVANGGHESPRLHVELGGQENQYDGLPPAAIPQDKVSRTPGTDSTKKGHRQRSVQDIANNNGGPFTSEEIAKMDAFCDRYCEANRITYAQFNDLAQSSVRGNKQVQDLFRRFHEILPYRPRPSVQKFVRRHFHNYSSRGSWTDEDDDQLRRAVAEKGKSWKVIGDIMDRMPGDCRDRWRDYILNSEHRNRQQWTEKEIQELCLAILECVQLMKEERRRRREEKYGPDSEGYEEDSEQEEDDLKDISWQAVSDRIGDKGGGRSRLQCQGKWKSLKQKDQRELMNAIKVAQGTISLKPNPTKNEWRIRHAIQKIPNMRAGDRYALLRAILDAKATTEENIPWRGLGDDQQRAMWTAREKRMAWEGMKGEVTGWQSMHFEDIARHLKTKIQSDAGDQLHDRWDPDVHGTIPVPRAKRKPKGKKREREDISMTENGLAEETNRSRRSTQGRNSTEEDEDQPKLDATDQPKTQNHSGVTFTPINASKHSGARQTAAPKKSSLFVSSSPQVDEEALERDSLFDGSDDDGDYAPAEDLEDPEDLDLTPDLASRVRSLQRADA